jgi:amidase
MSSDSVRVIGEVRLNDPARVANSDNLDDLCFTSAIDLARLIRSRQISATEVMAAHIAQIERLNPKVNAIPTFIGVEAAMSAAREADARLSRGDEPGPLHGLPHAVKDLVSTAGIRTTFGSPIYEHFVPTEDDLIVQRLKAAGAIVIGKTNTPEFGAGSHTFNPVFGSTRNPYDVTKSCGGSSGGAAVALACGMTPLADGSDLGGSLRNPASFCNIVGFRPSPGRVPSYPSQMAWNPLSVLGPMARSVREVAFMLSVIAGPDTRVPISINEDARAFSQPLQRDFKGVRIAWSHNLGGLPVDPEVSEVFERARTVFEALGCDCIEGEPDFSGSDEVFQTLRAWMFAQGHAHELEQHRNLIKETVVWNIEKGLRLTGLDVSSAEFQRTALFERVTSFMREHEFLILPVSQVAPFPVELEWIREINGKRMESYIDWMASCYRISLTGLPAISVPCGFTASGLPIGLQIVGRHQRDFEVLQMAYAFEQATQYGKRRPTICE